MDSEHGEFRYDRQRCEAKQIKDMQLMAAMAPPGGGRNAFSQRLQVSPCTLASLSASILSCYNYGAHYQIADQASSSKTIYPLSRCCAIETACNVPAPAGYLREDAYMTPELM